MRNGEKKKIYILLTRFPDNGSKVIGFLTNSFYTHASIGLEEDMNTFYSFVTKGFMIEKITKYVRPDREPYPCRLYEMEVSPQKYEAIKYTINGFIARKNIYRYSVLGVILGLFHIPVIQKHHYFCSQFVAEVLGNTDAVHLEKSSALYYPCDLIKLPNKAKIFEGDLQSFLRRFVLQTCSA